MSWWLSRSRYPFFGHDALRVARFLLRSGDSDYDLMTHFSNLACGIGSQVWGALSAIVSWYAYTFIADSLIWFIGGLAVVEIGCLRSLAIDLSYYWFHRISHRVRLFWSFHVVHHQSESYNLSVALRQSWFEASVLDLLHTVVDRRLASNGIGCRKIDKSALPILDTYAPDWAAPFWLRMDDEQPVESPCSSRTGRSLSRHKLRRHFFIVWDRIFGTYQAELDEPSLRYGESYQGVGSRTCERGGFQKIGSLYSGHQQTGRTVL